MPADGRIYDGHTFVFGVDTDTDSTALNSSTAAVAVNRVFRGGRNFTRPPFVHHPFQFTANFDFEGDAAQYEQVVRFGNFQGWMPYRKKKPGREDGAIVAIAGHIFFLTLVNERIFVRFVTNGNDPKLLHTWFVQAEEWVYIQNGTQRPLRWNGLFPSTASRAETDDEMPTGTIMAYVHGRVFVSNAFDQVAASDIIYGNGLTRSDATWFFTENQYWNEGGYFGQPTDLGHITGMGIIPRQDDKLNGQGELVIISEQGASAIEASIPRAQWKSTRIQAMTLSGRGCVASESVVVVNNDLWFRSDDGLTSYEVAKYDQKGKLSFGKISKQANRWFNKDTPWLLEFCSSIYFDNRVLTTVSPFLAAPSDLVKYGNHRYHRGIVALDLEEASGVQGDAPFNWDGLWTGMRPCALMKIGKRAFAFSYDADGENRIYELARTGIHDLVNEKPVQTKWFYITKKFDWRDTGKSNEFEVKKIVGGDVWVSDLKDRITIGVDNRHDNSPCWNELLAQQEVGSDFGNDWLFSYPRFKRLSFPSPKENCMKGEPYAANHGAQHQIMVFGEGHARIDRLRLGMAAMNDPDSSKVDCKVDDEKISLDKCKLEDDFSYEICDAL